MANEPNLTCAHCGADVTPADRFCETCGMRQPTQADHSEREAGGAAAITDRGKVHHRNEDAFALRATEDGASVVAVVCDGVSTSDRPDQAARLAADTAAAVLVGALAEGLDAGDAVLGAAEAADKAVTELADVGQPEDPDNSPACTFAAAVVSDEEIVVGWLGDSRAYWLSARPNIEGSALLTLDDSWAVEMVSAGELTAEEAAADPRAHAITGWLGKDADEDRPGPHVYRAHPNTAGVLLLCSDGLWNYRADPAELAGMVLPDALDAPLAAAKTLVEFAVHCGGRDNITVAVVPWPLPGRGGAE